MGSVQKQASDIVLSTAVTSDDSQVEFEKLECIFAEHEQLISENKSLKLDLSSLKNELDSTTEQLQKYTVMIVDLQNEKNDVEQLNIELKTKLADATQSLVSRDLKIDGLEAECRELNSQLKNSTQALNEQKATFELAAKCASHESKIISLSEKYSILEEDYNKTKTELDAANIELQTRLDESTQIVESRKMRIHELEDKCNDFCTKVEITTDSLRDQKSKFEELSSEATAYQDEKIKLMEKYTAMEIELRTAKAELAVRDSQEVKKENEDKLERRITSLKHLHSIEIEVMHLKRISEQEIVKLKSALAQDDDQKCTKGPQKRKRDEQDWIPTTKRTKKKLAESSENMPPGQKAISYGASKFRSVAQSVVGASSPRVTRGHKKLFNVKAAPSSGLPRWKL